MYNRFDIILAIATTQFDLRSAGSPLQLEYHEYIVNVYFNMSFN